MDFGRTSSGNQHGYFGDSLRAPAFPLLELPKLAVSRDTTDLGSGQQKRGCFLEQAGFWLRQGLRPRLTGDPGGALVLSTVIQVAR